MTRFLALALLVGLAFPAFAQVVPDEFPEPGEGPADRSRSDLVERHRPFLSRLYVESTLAAGPALGTPTTFGAAVVEGGYRFDSGDAVSLLTSVTAPITLARAPGEPVVGAGVALGAQYALSAARFAPSSGLARRTEVGLGVGYVSYDEAAVWSLDLAPRVTFPLTPVLSVPVGVRVSQEIGSDLSRGTFVGVSVGLRRIFADEARMVLE